MEFDQTQAYEEGWVISEVSGSSYFPDGWLNIEKLDTHPRFRGDFEAVAHVYGCAGWGSEYHKNAILYMEKTNFDRVRLLQDR